MISVECFKARHIWYKYSTWIFLIGRDYFWMGIKNRKKKRLSAKHCLSYGHSIAEISYGPLTPLLAYSYGKWIDWEYQLIFKWLFNIVKCNSNFSKYLVSTTLWQTQSIKTFNGKRICIGINWRFIGRAQQNTGGHISLIMIGEKE